MKRETFEKREGTDNQYEEVLGPGNLLDADFSNTGLPSSWGEQSGRIVVGPYSGGAMWVEHEARESPTGYQFSGSFYISKDGLGDENAITLFISKPDDWTGHLAAWRLYLHKQEGQLQLVLIVGKNTETNNPSAAGYMVPIDANQAYDVTVTYDTKRQFYLWTVNGEVQAFAAMPNDYPLISTEIIGSSGSSDGRNCEFIVDNVRWEELSASSDAFAGGAGNDRLAGGAGASADVLVGFGGNDRYYVDNPADWVIEAAGGGIDTVYASVDYALGAGQEIEFLRANAGTKGLTLVGNALVNTLVGGAGDDRLNGGAGADVLEGGAGDDRYYVDDPADRVIEAAGKGVDTVYASVDYALGAGQEIEFLHANAGAKGLTLVGNALVNTLVGGPGDDRLNGGGGADLLDGGSGDDRYYVDNPADRVIEAAGKGVDTVYASVDYALGAGQEIEFLRANAGARGLTLVGNGLSNTLVGGPGNDRLNGGEGADVLEGGTGNDRYYVDAVGDRVIEAAGGGTDTVCASVDYALGAGQEIEVLRANAGTQGVALIGNALDNTLVGGPGDDRLNGGAGRDRLTGGPGNDVFAFDQPLVAGNVKTIADFSPGHDRLALSLDFFGAAGSSGMLAGSAFHVGARAHDADDRLIYNAIDGRLMYDPDGIGGQAATVFAKLAPGLPLAASDFILA